MLSVPSIVHSLYRASPGFARHAFASLYAGWSNRYKFGPEYECWRRMLAESQWWPADRMKEFQRERLGHILGLARAGSAYYRRPITDASAGAGDDPFSVLDRLPVTSRRAVQENAESIRTGRSTDSRLVLSTSGTTGAFLRIPFTRSAFQAEYAFRWHHFATAGAKPGDRFVMFTGHEVTPAGEWRPPYHIRNFLERTVMFSVHHLAEETLASYTETFNRFRPDYVFGYPSSLSVFGYLLKDAGRSIRPPRAVFTSSEKLHPVQRRIIQEQFGARVYDLYGQVEHVAMLQECEEGRLHVKEEYGLIELLNAKGKPSKPGELGTLVATGWLNDAFPLLRYRMEDNMVLAEDQSCTCGRNGRIIGEVLGRDDDLIVTHDGRYLGSLEFLFESVGHIRECQIVQEDLSGFLIRVVPLAAFSGADEDTIILSAKRMLGADVSVHVEKVPRIPRNKSGKVKYVVSHVNKPWQV